MPCFGSGGVTVLNFLLAVSEVNSVLYLSESIMNEAFLAILCFYKVSLSICESGLDASLMPSVAPGLRVAWLKLTALTAKAVIRQYVG